MITPEALARFEALLAAGRDDPLLRLTLGKGCLEQDRLDEALAHLRRAVAQDADYGAAWKFLGRALERAGEPAEALAAYQAGAAAARRRGDKQLEREFGVFRKRLGDPG